MFPSLAHPRAAALSTLAAFALAASLQAQQPVPPNQLDAIPLPEPSSIALPLPEDRGAAALEQSLRRLSTTASVLAIVAHPDDEDGALLTYLSRGLGARCTLLSLTRGEGGQNAMSAETYDALGLIRTNELLKASEYYGVKLLFGTEIDFGFSKTQEEAFTRWGHERVLYDAVLAVRRERPQVIIATFVGGVTDGHGQHQVSGEIAQEAFKAAADPAVFPDQLKPIAEGGLGLTLWQPSAVYSMVPFARITAKGMFDYATNKWAPTQFKNYVTGEVIKSEPSTDVTMQVGTRDPVLGRSYVQISREGWGMQKSQYGGANPVLSGPSSTSYHLWAVVPGARAKPEAEHSNPNLFRNEKVAIDTTIAGLASLAPKAQWLAPALTEISTRLRDFRTSEKPQSDPDAARKLTPIYRATLDLRARVASTDLDAHTKASLLFELDIKIQQFQTALRNLLGLDLIAFTTRSATADDSGPRGGTADETPRSITPGQDLLVRIHTAHASTEVHLQKTWLDSHTGASWQHDETPANSTSTDSTADSIYKLKVPEDARPTQPYFSIPNGEQAFYDLAMPEYRERPFAPWPLAAWAEFTYDGLPIRIGRVVQTMDRVLGPGGVYEPLVVTPRIGVRIDPEARILPLDGSPLPVHVTVHTQGAAEATIQLKLPTGWTANPASATFHLAAAGDTDPIEFKVTPTPGITGQQTIQAIVQTAATGTTTNCELRTTNCPAFSLGWAPVGYPGLRPYNIYKPAQLLTRKVDVKLAPGLRIGYIMGTGDLVPAAIAELGVTPHMINTAELASSDFSSFNTIVIGIRAYSALPALTAAQPRLDQFVKAGGTLIVLYQSADFPAPFPLSLGRAPERVVDETDPVKLLATTNPVLTTPNALTPADFDGWVEERGHSFLTTWDSAYTPLTETADPGEDPQRGGLVVAHPGKGTYIYCAYAIHRQLPELVPGSYRILANLLSAGR